MAFLDLFMSGAQKRNRGHFSSIVKLALADNKLSDGEQKLINRMAVRLNISERTKQKILKDPNRYPLHPPVDLDGRIERLYNLTKMIFADAEAIEKEAALLVKLGVGLGFPTDNADAIAEEAIKLTMSDASLNDFSKKIKEIN